MGTRGTVDGELNFKTMRVAFQGEPGAFSEAAAVQLLGEEIRTMPRTTFDATFRAIAEGAADALLVPVENTLAGSVVRVYDLLLESPLEICGETILPIEHHLMACPGATFAEIRAVASHPVALGAMRTFFRAASRTEAGSCGRHGRQRARDDGARRQELRGDCGTAGGGPLRSGDFAREHPGQRGEFHAICVAAASGRSAAVSREGCEENVAGHAAGA